MKRPRDVGETLIEVVVAVTIMGLGGVAVIGGIADIRKDSTHQAQVATSYSLLTSFGDDLLTDPTWPGCESSAYATTVSAAKAALAASDPVSASYQLQLNGVLCWNGTGYSADAPSTSGLARLDLQVTSPDGYVATLSVVERNPTELPADGG
jgi:type II secretory pathway pseudopilin PulG